MKINAILLVTSSMLLHFDPNYAQAIRKIVDTNGVTYFTNEPPEKDPPANITPTHEPLVKANPNPRNAPVTEPAAASGAANASISQSASSKAKLPQLPTSAPVSLPINPAQALGDWPPKSLKLTPGAVP